MSPELAKIEERRRELGISCSALERQAGLADRYYASHLLFGRRAPSSRTLARLNLALHQLKLRQRCGDDRDYAIAIAYRTALVLAAQHLGIDPAFAQAQDPARRATQDPEWRGAADVRRLALYLLNAGCGFSQTDTARAAGLTKQAVSQACREIEDRRSDKAFDDMAERLTAALRGDW